MPKKFLIIAGAALAVAAIAAAAVYYVKQKENQAGVNTEVKTEVKPKVEVSAELKKSLDYTGGSSCDGVSDRAKQTECFNALNKAMNATTTNACAGLAAEQDRMVCEKAVFIQEVAASGDLSKCDAITDANNKIICVSQASLSLAIQKQDKSYCDNLTYPDDKAYCLKIIGEISGTGTTTPSGPDADADGLSDAEEKKYGTDPKNPDTDGDGNSDGVEVKNGYNPKGQGKLK